MTLIDTLVAQQQKCKQERCGYPEEPCACGYKCKRCTRGRDYRLSHRGQNR